MSDDLDRLLTERLILRRPTPRDTAAYFAIYGDPATHAFNPAGPVPDLAGAEADMARKFAHWERHGHGTWAACARSRPDEVLGFGGLARRLYGDEERTNLGFRFSTAAWGHGYATELATASLAVAWRLGLAEVWGTVRENHRASRRVLEKVGMVEVARVPDPHGAPASVWYVATAA